MKYIFLVLNLLVCTHLKGQIGIGIASPNINSVLDIKAKDKGVLFPLINNMNRNSMNLGISENSMWIMNSDTKVANFWNGQNWRTFQSIKQAVFTMDCSSLKNFSYLNVNQTASGYIQIMLNVAEPGSLSLQSNTQNGIRFIGAQSVDTGKMIFTLDVVGTPTSAGNLTFTIISNESSCTFPVTIN